MNTNTLYAQVYRDSHGYFLKLTLPPDSPSASTRPNVSLVFEVQDTTMPGLTQRIAAELRSRGIKRLPGFKFPLPPPP